MRNHKNNYSFINLNLNVRGLPQSATLAINEKSNQLKKQGKMIYRLGLGQSPFPVPQQVVDSLKNNAHQKDYLPVKGLPELRNAVADYYCRKTRVCFNGEDVMIGPGSKELMFLLQLVYYGDLVIPTPSWVSYAPQADIIGRHVRWINTSRENNWLLKPADLVEHCKDDPDKPRIVILNYPSNPCGVTYTIEELKAFARVARQYRIILLSDEIYGELHFQGRHSSIAQFYPEGTIISSGLSKWCGAGGWRLGIFVFPESLRWLQNAIANVASETFTSTSAPIQFAAVQAFRGSEQIESYLLRARWILQIIGKYIARKLKENGVNVASPEGAFYLFPDFSSYSEKLKKRGITNSIQLCERLLDETGVAILPGYSFGRPLEELTARIAYVDFDGTKAMSYALSISQKKDLNHDFLSAYCGNLIDAIDLIVNWLNN